jgi:hypothetical protein
MDFLVKWETLTNRDVNKFGHKMWEKKTLCREISGIFYFSLWNTGLTLYMLRFIFLSSILFFRINWYWVILTVLRNCIQLCDYVVMVRFHTTKRKDVTIVLLCVAVWTLMWAVDGGALLCSLLSSDSLWYARRLLTWRPRWTVFPLTQWCGWLSG